MFPCENEPIEKKTLMKQEGEHSIQKHSSLEASGWADMLAL